MNFRLDKGNLKNSDIQKCDGKQSEKFLLGTTFNCIKIFGEQNRYKFYSAAYSKNTFLEI